MRTVDFDTYYRKEKESFTRKRLSMTVPREERVRRRPRDPEEMRVLTILTKERFRRWQKEGKLKILGPREYLLK